MHPPIILDNTDLPRLFCKPKDPNFIYYSDQSHLPQLISFRSLRIDSQLPVIHQWVNMDYTSSFWQMDGPYAPFREMYQKIMDHPNAHSFVGFYGAEMICQLDVYMIGVDELSFQFPEEILHCGFHLLMAPNKRPVKGLTVAIVHAFLQYYFSFSEALKMYAEPDTRNERSIALLRKLGFVFLQNITLSYKSAYLYCLSRERFFSHQINNNGKVHANAEGKTAIFPT